MNKRKTIEKFKREIFDLTQNKFEIVSKEYINNKEKLLFKHRICNSEFWMRPNDFLQRKRCPICSKFSIEKLKETLHEKNKEKAMKLVISKKDHYDINFDFDNFKSFDDTFYCTCKKCNNTFLYSFAKLRDNNCAFCNRKLVTEKNTKSTKQFQIEVFNLVGDEYKVLGKYKNNKTKIKMFHSLCKKEFEMQPRYFLNQGCRCTHCANIGANSKPNKIIKEYLKLNQIKFESEIKFSDLKNKNYLPYDFGFFDNKNNLLLLLEYDGPQHKFPIFGERRLAECIKTDKKKEQYAKDHNYNLERIQYKNGNKTEIIKELENILKKYNIRSQSTIESNNNVNE